MAPAALPGGSASALPWHLALLEATLIEARPAPAAFHRPPRLGAGQARAAQAQGKTTNLAATPRCYAARGVSAAIFVRQLCELITQRAQAYTLRAFPRCGARRRRCRQGHGARPWALPTRPQLSVMPLTCRRMRCRSPVTNAAYDCFFAAPGMMTGSEVKMISRGFKYSASSCSVGLSAAAAAGNQAQVILAPDGRVAIFPACVALKAALLRLHHKQQVIAPCGSAGCPSWAHRPSWAQRLS
jgi:hypothetical protein